MLNNNHIDLLTSVLPQLLVFAQSCRDPETVKQISLEPSNVNPNPAYITDSTWSDIGLSGYAALLIFYATLDTLFPNDEWDKCAHAYVLKIKESLETFGFPRTCSIYGGLASLCFAIHFASRRGSRYQRMLGKLDDALLENVEHHCLLPLSTNFKEGRSVPAGLYDLIQGIVGVGLYCLQRQDDPKLCTLAASIISSLIQLTYPIKIDGHLVPGWYLSQENQFIQEDKESFPRGNFNLGLAHGIPGVLAFLAVAKLQGIHLAGQIEAMERISSWLQARCTKGDGLFYWRGQIPFEEEIGGVPKKIAFNRKAWCYGTPGVARSLYLAGKALNCTDLKTFAVRSFNSIFQNELWGLPGPTICHGLSGLLLTTHFMAKDSSDPSLVLQRENLTQKLWNFYLPNAPFGFCDLDPQLGGGYASLHKPGLLDGATGVWLTLLSLENDVPCWHLPFLVNHE